jgi:RHS repeat-associated protein
VIDPVRDVAIWTWDLKGEAFGKTPPNQDPDSDGTAFVFDMRFPGQRYDVATGLNQNYFRDYDPGTGRYAQSDPIGLSGGKGTFSYANSHPMYLYDEIGLRAKCRCTPAGVEININLEFIGAAADPQVVASMRSSIEQIWSTPDFKVTTSIGGWRATKIEVVPGTGTSYMQGNRGKWFAANDPWVAAHEAGHIMKFKYDGRFDMYDIVSENPRKSVPVQGWEGNIMGQFFGQPDNRARDTIKRELKCK